VAPADPIVDIPKAALDRLPIYLRCAVRCLGQGVLLVSSEALAEAAGVNASQVRKDFRYIHQVGTPGVGYDVRSLVYQLEDILGLAKAKEAVLVGAGNLGSALVQYPGFQKYGLKIVALFDADPSKVGTMVGGSPVLSADKLRDLPLRMGIRLGIICTPAEVAQAVANTMVEAGIKAIWNFAPADLTVPPDVWIQNEDLAAHLATLSYHMARGDHPELAEPDQ
jgi:redox-sensing transcriptional repressor